MSSSGIRRLGRGQIHLRAPEPHHGSEVLLEGRAARRNPHVGSRVVTARRELTEIDGAAGLPEERIVHWELVRDEVDQLAHDSVILWEHRLRPAPEHLAPYGHVDIKIAQGLGHGGLVRIARVQRAHVRAHRAGQVHQCGNQDGHLRRQQDGVVRGVYGMQDGVRGHVHGQVRVVDVDERIAERRIREAFRDDEPVAQGGLLLTVRRKCASTCCPNAARSMPALPALSRNVSAG